MQYIFVEKNFIFTDYEVNVVRIMDNLHYRIVFDLVKNHMKFPERTFK